jgi:hypothetical protein
MDESTLFSHAVRRCGGDARARLPDQRTFDVRGVVEIEARLDEVFEIRIARAAPALLTRSTPKTRSGRRARCVCPAACRSAHSTTARAARAEHHPRIASALILGEESERTVPRCRIERSAKARYVSFPVCRLKTAYSKSSDPASQRFVYLSLEAER